MQTPATPVPASPPRTFFVEIHVDRQGRSPPPDPGAPGGNDGKCARQARAACPQPLHGPSLGGSSWFGKQWVRLARAAADGVKNWFSGDRQSWPAMHAQWVEANEQLDAALAQLRWRVIQRDPDGVMSPGAVVPMTQADESPMRMRELKKQIADKVRAAKGAPVGGDLARSAARIWAGLDKNVIDPVSTVIGNLWPWSAPEEPAGATEEAIRI